MTVLVGLYCKDGIVIGADSAATFTHGPTPTISQLTTKIDIVEDRIIVAFSGSVGLGQRLQHHIEKECKEKGFEGGLHSVSTSITRRILKDFSESGVRRHPQLGLGFGALLAAPISGTPYLIEYDSVDFQPEQKTETLPFVAMGAGQPIADPFLGFIRRVFWNNDIPSLREGIFGAVWALTHTIQLNPGMVGGPVQVAVLERTRKGKWHARKYSDDELGEHKEHCTSIEEHLAEYRPRILGEIESEEPLEVPRPPST